MRQGFLRFLSVLLLALGVPGVVAPAAASCWVCRGSGCWPAGELEYGRKLCFRPYGWCKLAGTLCATGGGGDDGGIDEQDWLKPTSSGPSATGQCQAFATSKPVPRLDPAPLGDSAPAVVGGPATVPPTDQ